MQYKKCSRESYVFKENFKLEKGVWSKIICKLSKVDNKNNFAVSQKMENNRAEDITLEKITCLEHRKPGSIPGNAKNQQK